MKLVVPEAVKRVEEEGEAFGMHEPTEESPILIEYANPNTHKEIHLGHLRNFLTGRAFVSVLKAAGKQVVPVSFVNDQGANVAKTLWWILKKNSVPLVEDIEPYLSAILKQVEHTGRELGRLYSEATKAEEQDVEAATGISFVQSMLEAHNPGYEQLWMETRNWCLAELNDIFRQLDIQVEKQYLESECIDRAQEVVEELIKKGIVRESQGAYIVDLEDKKLGVMLVRKSDGNLLYASKDLALAEKKVVDYPACNTYYSVVDVRQSLYFKQLAEVLRQLGYTPSFQALTYEILRLPEGAMSSRKGNIVTFQDLQEDVFVYAKQEVVSRHSEWDAAPQDSQLRSRNSF
jgi:arginyl-tRNA synthetase